MDIAFLKPVLHTVFKNFGLQTRNLRVKNSNIVSIQSDICDVVPGFFLCRCELILRIINYRHVSITFTSQVVESVTGLPVLLKGEPCKQLARRMFLRKNSQVRCGAFALRPDGSAVHYLGSDFYHLPGRTPGDGSTLVDSLAVMLDSFIISGQTFWPYFLYFFDQVPQVASTAVAKLPAVSDKLKQVASVIGQMQKIIQVTSKRCGIRQNKDFSPADSLPFQNVRVERIRDVTTLEEQCYMIKAVLGRPERDSLEGNFKLRLSSGPNSTSPKVFLSFLQKKQNNSQARQPAPFSSGGINDPKTFQSILVMLNRPTNNANNTTQFFARHFKVIESGILLVEHLPTLAEMTTRLHWSQILEILSQQAHNLCVLASKGIVHRNIRAENILLDEERNCSKLRGFEDAILVSSSNYETEVAMSNDKVDGYFERPLDQCFTPATDLFRFAQLFFELLTGVPPFSASAKSKKKYPLFFIASSTIPDCLARPIAFLTDVGTEAKPQDRISANRFCAAVEKVIELQDLIF